MWRSQKLDGSGHGGLDVDRLDVVPALLEERGQEIEGHHDVLLELVIGHIGAADGGGEAGDLLELELDGSLDVIELVLEGSVVVNDKRESLDLGEDGSDNSWHLLEDGVRGEKSLRSEEHTSELQSP